jgi:hypothetical protein
MLRFFEIKSDNFRLFRTLSITELHYFYNIVRESVTMSAIMIIELVLQCVTLH